MRCTISVCLYAIFCAGSWTAQAADFALDYEAMATRIVSALKLRKGERVMMRPEPGYFRQLLEPLRRLLVEAGAVEVPSLDQADVYLWLPLRTEVSAQRRTALSRWLDRGGAHRQIHFHWSDGSRQADGLLGVHSAAFDRIYQEALDIDYAALSSAQERAIAILRSGTVRVRTPAGGDLSFRVGDRPFNKQNGDASAQRARAALVRIDREIELPAGVLRVGPVEETVNGHMVIPKARFGDKVAQDVRLEIKMGRVTRIEADENQSVVEAALAAGGAAARRFREFGLGFNPRLGAPAGTSTLAYYGYGAGVVRLSLGDNQELGGKVRGDFVRWFFFPDATVTVDGRELVRDGKLVE
jgi:hypothetical protein